MNFPPFQRPAPLRPSRPEQQAAAWDAFIEQDPYLSKHRGEYAQRGAVFLPIVQRSTSASRRTSSPHLGGQRHAVPVPRRHPELRQPAEQQLGRRPAAGVELSRSPTRRVDAQGRATYRLRVINNELMTNTLEQTAGINDVYRVMFSLKYFFGS